jgi:hypothetical protein
MSDHSHPTPSRTNGAVRLRLSYDHAEQLAPLAIDAAQEHKNVLLIASVVPFWSPQNDGTTWELQVVMVKAAIGYKIAKLIRDSLQQPRT